MQNPILKRMNHGMGARTVNPILSGTTEKSGTRESRGIRPDVGAEKPAVCTVHAGKSGKDPRADCGCLRNRPGCPAGRAEITSDGQVNPQATKRRRERF